MHVVMYVCISSRLYVDTCGGGVQLIEIRIGINYQIDEAQLPVPREKPSSKPGSAAGGASRGRGKAGRGAKLLFSEAGLGLGLEAALNRPVAGLSRAQATSQATSQETSHGKGHGKARSTSSKTSGVEEYLSGLAEQMVVTPGMFVWVPRVEETKPPKDSAAVGKAKPRMAGMVGKAGKAAKGGGDAGRICLLEAARVAAILADGSVEVILLRVRAGAGQRTSRSVVQRSNLKISIDHEHALTQLMQLGTLGDTRGRGTSKQGEWKKPSPPEFEPVTATPFWSHHEHVRFVDAFAEYVAVVSEVPLAYLGTVYDICCTIVV